MKLKINELESGEGKDSEVSGEISGERREEKREEKMERSRK